jgi:hypothetical protein
MIKIFRDDTQWAIAGKVDISLLELVEQQLPEELQGEGSRVVSGTDGFTALLVFGGQPNETLARRLLESATPVYLMDFDDEAPVTLKLDRKKTGVTETRVHEHPADFLAEHGITPPGGYGPLTTSMKDAGIVEGASVAEVRRALPKEARDVALREHERGVLLDNAIFASWVADDLGKRALLVFRDPEDLDGWFSCEVHEPGKKPAAYAPVRPDPDASPLDNFLGETTLEDILRVLAIPGELLGLP